MNPLVAFRCTNKSSADYQSRTPSGFTAVVFWLSIMNSWWHLAALISCLLTNNHKPLAVSGGTKKSFADRISWTPLTSHLFTDMHEPLVVCGDINKLSADCQSITNPWRSVTALINHPLTDYIEPLVVCDGTNKSPTDWLYWTPGGMWWY